MSTQPGRNLRRAQGFRFCRFSLADFSASSRTFRNWSTAGTRGESSASFANVSPNGRTVERVVDPPAINLHHVFRWPDLGVHVRLRILRNVPVRLAQVWRMPTLSADANVSSLSRLENNRSIINRPTADGWSNRAPGALSNGDDQIRCLGTHNDLEPAPFRERSFNIVLGTAIGVWIGQRFSRFRLDHDLNRLGVQDISR